MSDLRDFLNWFDGFAENIEKTPTAKQWAKIKERVASLSADPVVLQSREVGQPKAAPPPPKPAPVYPFIVDTDNIAKNGKTKQPVTPEQVGGETLYDLRGMDGDMKTIQWADGSAGIINFNGNIAGV